MKKSLRFLFWTVMLLIVLYKASLLLGIVATILFVLVIIAALTSKI